MTDRIFSQITDIATLLRQTEYQAGLYPAQWAALRYLATSGERGGNVTGFAQSRRTTLGTASITMNVLIKKGYVRRAGRDSRVRLSLTAEGRRLLESDPLRRLEAALATRLTGEDREQFRRYLDLARQVFEADLAGDRRDEEREAT